MLIVNYKHNLYNSDDKILQVLPSIWDFFLKQGEEQEEAISQVFENLKLLDEELKGKKFFGGEKIGLTDLVLGWLANTVCVLEEVVGFKIIEKERFPLLSAWMLEFAEVPVIKENWPPYEKLLAKFHAVRQASLAAALPK